MTLHFLGQPHFDKSIVLGQTLLVDCRSRDVKLETRANEESIKQM